MANIFELKTERKERIDAADAIIAAAERGKRSLTSQENQTLNENMAVVDRLNAQIKVKESQNTLSAQVRHHGPAVLYGNPNGEGRPFSKPQTVTFSEEYADAFYSWIGSNGAKMSAALNEGTGSAGGFAVPIVVDGQIVPLAPQEMGVRKLANVIPTTSDIKVPTHTAFSTATAKSEGSAFTESEPVLGQFTLSAYMAGVEHIVSWELAHDVPSFLAFCVDDMLIAQATYEENLYVNGTGSGQAQGLIGNVSTPLVREPDSNGNMVSISAVLDLVGQLNAMYHPNGAFLMQRATGIVLRKAQVQANLFEPVWTRVGTQDYLLGYPVEYSTSMPSAARGNTPVLFGDFKRGYVIGDRGGSGINVKVLDQPLATQGQIILLAYRRTDGRVRRSEAIQALQVALS